MWLKRVDGLEIKALELGTVQNTFHTLQVNVAIQIYSGIIFFYHLLGGLLYSN